MNGKVCSQISNLGPNLALFCSEFLSVNETVCSTIGQLGLFCSECLFLSGTVCSQIDNLGPFIFRVPICECDYCPELVIWEQISDHFVSYSYFVLK